jgi:hypothetical protein
MCDVLPAMLRSAITALQPDSHGWATVVASVNVRNAGIWTRVVAGAVTGHFWIGKFE